MLGGWLLVASQLALDRRSGPSIVGFREQTIRKYEGTLGPDVTTEQEAAAEAAVERFAGWYACVKGALAE